MDPIFIFIIVAVAAFFIWAMFQSNAISFRKKNKKQKSSDKSSKDAYVIPEPEKAKKAKPIKIKKRNLEEDYKKQSEKVSNTNADQSVKKGEGGGQVERVFVEPAKNAEVQKPKEEPPKDDGDDFEKELDKLIMDLEREKRANSPQAKPQTNTPVYQEQYMGNGINPTYQQGPNYGYDDLFFDDINSGLVAPDYATSYSRGDKNMEATSHASAPQTQLETPTSNDFDFWGKDENIGKEELGDQAKQDASTKIEEIKPTESLSIKKVEDDSEENIIVEPEDAIEKQAIKLKASDASEPLMDKSSFDDRYKNGFVVDGDESKNYVVVSGAQKSKEQTKKERNRWL